MNEYLIKMLLAGEVIIIFRKKENGLLRNLIGTLEVKSIPPEHLSTWSTLIESYEYDPNQERIVVWDTEKNDWRSFYIETVLSVQQSEIKDQTQLEE